MTGPGPLRPAGVGDGSRAAAVRVLRAVLDWSLPAAAWQPRTHPARTTVATALRDLEAAYARRDGTAFAAALGDLRRLAAPSHADGARDRAVLAGSRPCVAPGADATAGESYGPPARIRLRIDALITALELPEGHPGPAPGPGPPAGGLGDRSAGTV